MTVLIDDPITYSSTLAISYLDKKLTDYFGSRLHIEPSLTRQIVSFQDSKNRAVHRWFKYKEAFSANLVERFLRNTHLKEGYILDPFAGIGTTLFTANRLGFDAIGIELLPIGVEVITARYILEHKVSVNEITILKYWRDYKPWRKTTTSQSLSKLTITDGAYPEATLESIELFLGAISTQPLHVKQILRFALLCILESVSFTRKDGQYLRWDYRSGRRQGANPFNKGVILDFDVALVNKLREIVEDIEFLSFDNGIYKMEIDSSAIPASDKLKILQGSCLNELRNFPANNVDAIITSPPYCNRYDYTRTYALELALLGLNNAELITLRQEMLSCTVENKPKELLYSNNDWSLPIAIVSEHDLLNAILFHLDDQKNRKLINNMGIPRMVKGYFYEMACLIYECFRVMKSGSRLFMVNDNVRYAGVSISVDLILSDIAEKIGFDVQSIMVLPQSKGNSSQQMGIYGKDSLRKCVYIWKKP